jgi:uncharacterized protein
MAGIEDLQTLIKNMKPVLSEQDYVFCTLGKVLDDEILTLNPLCMMQEEEGITLILEKAVADKAGFPYSGVYHKITLLVHSSLEAVGLTAAFSKALTDHDISANVIAGYYHDHIFVPKAKASRAMKALQELTG